MLYNLITIALLVSRFASCVIGGDIGKISNATSQNSSLSEDIEGSGSSDEWKGKTSSSYRYCRFTGPNISLLKSKREGKVCCAEAIKDFRWEWFRGGNYLQTFFAKLKLWKCEQLESICANQVYAKYSGYSKMVYLYHCNSTVFQQECSDVIFPDGEVIGNTSFEKRLLTINPSDLSTESLLEPCMQVALYHSNSGGYGFYHEIVDTFAPFCDISWCGFDAKSIQDRGISSWTCMSSGCRANLIISSIVCALLSLAIALANVTVIVVFTTSPKLRNSQAVYKISLAIADLLVGFFVIPTFISSLMLLYKAPASMGNIMRNASLNSEGTIQRQPGGRFFQRFSLEYLDFVGFFTILSLVVSLYTLMMASCDRFMAIYQPLRYGRHNAKRIAIWTSLFLWVIAIFLSAMPYFVPEMKYGLVASVMVASHGESALFLYAIAVALPLLVVWISTLATYFSTKHHARRRQALTVRRSNSGGGNTSNMETRLAQTLASMVGIFTLCLLPPAIVLIVPFCIGNIYHHLPESFSPSASKAFISLEFVAILCLMTNSLWNCFIYNARNEEFKITTKRLYGRLLKKLGLACLFKGSKDWANATVRSNRTGFTTTGISSLKQLQKKPSKQTLRTMPSNYSGTSGPRSPTSNDKSFPEFLSTGNSEEKVAQKGGTSNPSFEQLEGSMPVQNVEQEIPQNAQVNHNDVPCVSEAV